MRINESVTQGHSIKFIRSTIVVLTTLVILYSGARYFLGLDDSLGMATYLTGILGAAVGLAGAWVAIIIAEIATRAQVQANKYDNPYYQKANVIINAAKDFIATFEFLVASAKDMRRHSFAEGNANIVVLTSACESVQRNLEHQLMSTGLYSLLCQLENYYNKRDSTPQLIQNILGLIGELSRTQKTIDLTNDEAESLMAKYVLATLNLNYLAKLVTKVPSVELLTELLENNVPFSSKFEKEHGIKITSSIREECEIRNEQIIEQIFVSHELRSTEESTLLDNLVGEVVHGMVDKIDINARDKDDYFRSLPDLSENKNTILSALQKCYPKANLADRVLDEIQPVRAALIDFGTFRIDDLFKSISKSISFKIFGDQREIVVIRSLRDFDDHLTDDGIEYANNVYILCHQIKRLARQSDNATEADTVMLNTDPSEPKVSSVASESSKQDLIKRVESIYGLVDENLSGVIRSLTSMKSKLFVIELNDDCDFYAKVKLANALPYAILHWCYFPYLPSPGFQPKKFFEEASLEGSVQGKLPSCFPSIRSLTPLIATGSMLVINNDGPDKSKDKKGYAYYFDKKYVAVRSGEL